MMDCERERCWLKAHLRDAEVVFEQYALDGWLSVERIQRTIDDIYGTHAKFRSLTQVEAWLQSCENKMFINWDEFARLCHVLGYVLRFHKKCKEDYTYLKYSYRELSQAIEFLRYRNMTGTDVLAHHLCLEAIQHLYEQAYQDKILKKFKKYDDQSSFSLTDFLKICSRFDKDFRVMYESFDPVTEDLRLQLCAFKVRHDLWESYIEEFTMLVVSSGRALYDQCNKILNTFRTSSKTLRDRLSLIVREFNEEELRYISRKMNPYIDVKIRNSGFQCNKTVVYWNTVELDSGFSPFIEDLCVFCKDTCTAPRKISELRKKMLQKI